MPPPATAPAHTAPSTRAVNTHVIPSHVLHGFAIALLQERHVVHPIFLRTHDSPPRSRPHPSMGDSQAAGSLCYMTFARGMARHSPPGLPPRRTRGVSGAKNKLANDVA